MCGFGFSNLFAQEKIEKDLPSGWEFSGLPIIAFNSDIGLKYGAFGALSYYGKKGESIYPATKHYLYFELSRTNRGGARYQTYYMANEPLNLPFRVLIDLYYGNEDRLTFWGFNGAEAVYEPSLEMPGDPHYISDLYYRHARRHFRFVADLEGDIGASKFSWFGGLGHYDFKITSLAEAEGLSLYDQYVTTGAISSAEADGGRINLLRLGLVYDTRDRKQNPTRGMWTELLFIQSSSQWGSDESFTKLSAAQRMYFPLLPDRLTLATRLAYQGTLTGRAPSYFQSFLFTTDNGTETMEGLGGMRSMRGILRNRLVGAGVAYGTMSLRWKLFDWDWKRRDIEIYSNTFSDFGQVVQRIDYDHAAVGVSPRSDVMHAGAGQGIYMVVNQNFVLYISCASSFRKQDRVNGIYFSTGWLF